MARFLVNDDRYRELIYDGGHRSDPFAHPFEGDQSAGNYRFARVQDKTTLGPLNRVNGTFSRVIEAIVDSKLRRMERELELRGIPARNPR
jgi:hypothetical protein